MDTRAKTRSWIASCDRGETANERKRLPVSAPDSRRFRRFSDSCRLRDKWLSHAGFQPNNAVLIPAISTGILSIFGTLAPALGKMTGTAKVRLLNGSSRRPSLEMRVSMRRVRIESNPHAADDSHSLCDRNGAALIGFGEYRLQKSRIFIHQAHYRLVEARAFSACCYLAIYNC